MSYCRLHFVIYTKIDVLSKVDGGHIYEHDYVVLITYSVLNFSCLWCLWLFRKIADLNALAALISNMFMTVYALLNFSAFHASLVRPPSWRPTFRVSYQLLQLNTVISTKVYIDFSTTTRGYVWLEPFFASWLWYLSNYTIIIHNMDIGTLVHE